MRGLKKTGVKYFFFTNQNRESAFSIGKQTGIVKEKREVIDRKQFSHLLRTFRSRKKPDYSHMEKTSAGIFKKILAKAGKNPVYVWFKSEWQRKNNRKLCIRLLP